MGDNNNTSNSASSAGNGRSSGGGKQVSPEEQALRALHAKEMESVSLLRSPVFTTRLLLAALVSNAKGLLHWLSLHRMLVSAALLLGCCYVVLRSLDGAHQPQIAAFEFYVSLAAWWIGLGILSSVGLGTGLHTFVLYLGPYIARVTLTATECRSLNFTRYGEGSFVCPATAGDGSDVAFLSILLMVQAEAMLWGLGTAIGELPPYFIARAARLAGQSLEELDDEVNASALSRAAQKLLLKLGFVGILLFAAIPNPLFDLAGLCCGHFLVPFWTFFGATAIGKAVVKVHLQMSFVILMFSVERIESIVSLIESNIPQLKGRIHPFLEAERAKLHKGASTGAAHAAEAGAKSWLSIGRLWDMFLIVMITYFVMSIATSLAQQELSKRHDRQLNALAHRGGADGQAKRPKSE